MMPDIECQSPRALATRIHNSHNFAIAAPTPHIIDGCFFFQSLHRNTYTADVAIRKVANSLADSVDLRIVLSVLYIVTEVMRAEKSADGEFQHHVDDFVVEISEFFFWEDDD